MSILVTVPGRGEITFHDDATDDEIQKVIAKEFPLDGQDITERLANNPAYAKDMTRDEFLLMRKYKEENPVSFGSKVAAGMAGIGEVVGKAFTTPPEFQQGAGPLEKANSIVANVGQAALLGLGDFSNLFLSALENYNEDNNSYEKFLSTRKLKDSPETKAQYENVVDDELNNFRSLQNWQQSRKEILGQSSMPYAAEAGSFLVQPPLPIAAAMEVLGVGGKIGAATSRAAQATGRAIRGAGELTSEVASIPQRIAASTAEAITGNADVAARVEQAVTRGTTGLAAGQLGLGLTVPGLSTTATAIAGTKLAGRGMSLAGELIEKVADHAAKGEGRIGVFEGLAKDLSASTAARTIGRIGSVAGADVVAPYLAAASRGVAEGAVVGGLLGYMADGEDGAAGGIGAGLTLGAAGGLAGRAYMQGKGYVRQQRVINDAVRATATMDAPNRANASVLFDRMARAGHHESVAEIVDVRNWLSGDVEFRFVTDAEAKAMPETNGIAFEGVTVVPKGKGAKPSIIFNVDAVKPGTGFHESFHGAMRTALGETIGKRIFDGVDTTFTPAQKAKFYDDYVNRGRTEDAKQKLRDYLNDGNNLVEEMGAEYFRQFLQRRENRDLLLRGERTSDGAVIAKIKGGIDFVLRRMGVDGYTPNTGHPGLDALVKELIVARTDINKAMAKNGRPLTEVPLGRMPTRALVDWANDEGQGDVLLRDAATGDVIGVRTEEQVNVARDAAYQRSAEELASVPRGVNNVTDAELAVYKKHLAPEHFNKLVFLNEAQKSGNIINSTYFPASKKDGEGTLYASRGSTNRDIVVHKIRTTAKGAVAIEFLDVTQLRSRFDDIMSRPGVLERWGGNKDAAWTELIDYSRNLSLGDGVAKPSAELFGPIKRDIFNKIYGFVPTKAQLQAGEVRNVSSLGINTRAESGTGKQQIGKPAFQDSKDTRVVSTMRLDRLGKLVDLKQTFPFNESGSYKLSQVNFKPAEVLPNGKVYQSDDGYKIIERNGRYSLFDSTQQRVGIFSSAEEASAKAQRSANKAEIKTFNETRTAAGPLDPVRYSELVRSAPEVKFLPADQQPENAPLKGRLTKRQAETIRELSDYYARATPERMAKLEADAVDSLATRLINKGVPVTDANKLAKETFSTIRKHVDKAAQVISGLGQSDLSRMAGRGRPAVESRETVNPVWLTSAFEAFKSDTDLAVMKAQQVARQLNKDQQAAVARGEKLDEAKASNVRSSTFDQGIGFVIGEMTADKKAFGSSLREDPNAAPRVYASVVEGQKFGSQGNYNIFFEWNRDTPMVVTSHHHYGVGNGLTDIHASANVGDKNARSFGSPDAEKYVQLPSGRQVLDTHLLVGNQGATTARAHQLTVSIPASSLTEIGKMAKARDVESIRHVLDRVAYTQLVGSNSQGKTAQFTSPEGVGPKVAIQRNRTEAYVLNPDLANVQRVTIVSNKPNEVRLLKENLQRAFENNGVAMPEVRVVSADSGPSRNPGRKAITDAYQRHTGKIAFMPGEAPSPAQVVLDELKRSNFISSKVARATLGTFPEYLRPVAQFIADQRQKLVSGSITQRDLLKAYMMTIASQGSGAVKVKTLADKLAKIGIKFDPPQMFRTEKGDMIRPEEAAAYWLGTEAGQRALNNADAGTINPADWQSLVEVRKAYGDDRFATFRVFTPDNIAEIPNVLAAINASKGDSKKVIAAVQQLKGIATGKKGFISHLLGIGDVPTIDAVELNFWLTGKGDIGNLKTKKADLARRVKESFSDRRVGNELFRRIDERIGQLKGEVEGADSVSPDVWAHIMHHWLWDRAKGIETSHAGLYEAQRNFMPDSQANNWDFAQRQIDSGFFVSGRGRRGPRQTRFDQFSDVIQFTKSPTVADQYGRGGFVLAVRPNEKAVVWRWTENGARDVWRDFSYDFENGSLSLENEKTFQSTNQESFINDLRASGDIVNGAGLWDSRDFAAWFYDKYGVDWVEIGGKGDGAVLLNNDPYKFDVASNEAATSSESSPKVNFMPEAMPNGTVYRGNYGYTVVNKTGGKFRVFSPVGELIAVAKSLEEAERLIAKRL